MGFWFKQILAGRIPLVNPFCQDDINFIAGLLVLDGKLQLISWCLT
jgi:hypothetical protein